MNIRHLLHIRGIRATGAAAMLGLLLSGADVTAAEPMRQGENLKDESKILTGSGKAFQTTVERQTTGELTDQDLHQASLLASRIVKHLNEAVQGLSDQNAEAAKAEVEKALKLMCVVRGLLPVTTATTVVRDAGGNEVYRDVDKVQTDRIPIYSGMIATEVVEAVIDSKSKDAKIKGLLLADANAIRTAVLADLGYLERKLNRARALIDKPDDALAQLTLAQTRGIEIVVNKDDTPLVQVQQALRLAERMVEEGRHEAARDNLRMAQVQLGAYRALVGKGAGKVVKQLEDDIAALMAKTEEKGASGKIRGFWERAVKLFREEPGQTKAVGKEAAPEANQPATGKK